jgi:antitoxin component YwqK of YwqJK toxin-antitoxin module
VDDLPEGIGRMKLADGTVYIGSYRDGLKNGEVKMIRPDGTSVVGTFENDLRNGVFKEYDDKGRYVKTMAFVNGMQR